MNQHLLKIELQTLNIQQIDPDNLDLVPTISIFLDDRGNYHFGTGMEELQAAIVAMIPYFNSHHNYPLLFEVKILPGTRINAFLASVHRTIGSNQSKTTN